MKHIYILPVFGKVQFDLRILSKILWKSLKTRILNTNITKANSQHVGLAMVLREEQVENGLSADDNLITCVRDARKWCHCSNQI